MYIFNSCNNSSGKNTCMKQKSIKQNYMLNCLQWKICNHNYNMIFNYYALTSSIFLVFHITKCSFFPFLIFIFVFIFAYGLYSSPRFWDFYTYKVTFDYICQQYLL